MSTSTVTNRAQILKGKFSVDLGLPLRELLPESRIEQVVKELGLKYRNRLFNPVVTVWALEIRFAGVRQGFKSLPHSSSPLKWTKYFPSTYALSA